MKRFILLIPAMLLTMMASATSQTISPSSEESDSNIRSALSGSADTIILNEGNYKEADQIHFRRNAVIMAAEGAEVIITPKYYCDFVNENTKVKIIGIKFDGSVSGQQAILASDANTGKELRLENCEFYNFAKDAVGTYDAAYTMDSCIVNNCYFHDNNRSSLYFVRSSVEGKQTIYGLKVTNSTFAKINVSSEYRSVIDVCSYASDGSHPDATDDIEVVVDHCTFYNNTTMNYDYSAIRTRIINRTTVSNCIFAHPSLIEFYATNLWAGSVTNCLAYNFNKGYSAPTKTEANTGNPLFNDLANNRYTFDGDWSTGSISPARGAATDGSDLGDPRWYTEEILPTTSFASDYVFLGTKAMLSGSFALNGDNYIQSQDKTYAGVAKWKIHAERPCIVEVTLNIADANTSGHRYEVAIYDADKVLVGTALAEPANSWSHGDKVLGTYAIPAAGDYTVKLTNDCNNSSTIIEGVTFAYYGGAVQNIATDANTTLNVADAWFTSGATRADGQISYSSWNTEDAWIKWNIATSETKFYDLTLNFSSTNAHSMAVNIYEDEEASPVATVSESFTETTGTLTLTDRINLVGGKNYIVKVTNPTSGSQAKVTSVVFVPVVATATELPGTLAFSNAVLSEKANITDGMLYFNEPGADKDPIGQWAQWEVTTDHTGLFLFTMGVASANEQTYKISILDNLDNVLDFSESNPGSGDKTIKHYFPLNAGSYFVKVENTRSFSKGHLTSLVVSEPESASIVTLDEAATDNTSWSDKVVAPEAEGPLYDVQIIRTIKAGMYNTICLPFEVTSEQVQAIFGTDVQLRTLASATIEEGDFVLNLNFTNTSSMYPGTPHLIMTSRDIVNPVFTGVKFTRETPASTTKTNANFVGTFIKGTIPASEDNLFMGANNTLYFPTVDTEILGMRGYFVIHDAPAGVIQRARIVEADAPAVTTGIKSVEVNGSVKTIENGQLVIIRDGKKYNVMGVRMK